MGLTRSAKALVQQGLGSLKFEAGPADELFGKKTRGAIKAWQEAKGYEGSGYLTAEQAEELQAAGKPAKRKPVKRDFRAGEAFKDCDDCPEMVVVPAGEFQMGSTRWVRIPAALAVGRYEVAVEEYRRFIGETGRDMSGGCRVYDADERKWRQRSDRSWEDLGFGQTARSPVECVSWEDAKAYVEWLREKTGKGYRLLSEAEWEYAARAGTTARRYWGDDEGNKEICENANGGGGETKLRFRNKACGDGYRYTSPVETFGSNAWGLHDVLGNVWEWLEDCEHSNYEGAPSGGEPWVTGEDCGKRLLRGGSWNIEPWNLRTGKYVRWFSPGNRYDFIGFRVARTLTR